MKLAAKLLLVLLICQVSLFQGCGDHSSVPDGSILVFDPASVTFKGIPGDTAQNFRVIARYPDETPIPYARIRIYGQFAAPAPGALYQFYWYPNGTQQPNVAIDSGYEAQTNEYGVAEFSIEITAGTSSFEDTLYAVSGTASVSAVLKFE